MSSEEKFDSKTLKIYAKIAQDYRTHSPIVAYFLTIFVNNKALETLRALQSKGQDDPELSKDVQDWFRVLDEIKREIDPNELQNQELCRKLYYEYMYSQFLKADNKYRDDDYSTQLAQDFFYVTAMFDGYSTLVPSDPEVLKHKKYAKLSRLKIMKAIKTGNLPIPKTKPAQTGSETEIPEDHSHGAKTMGDFKANQSIINRNSQATNNQPQNFNAPYGGGMGNQPTSYPQDFGFGGGNTGGLPDFTKFGGVETKPTNLGYGETRRPEDNNTFGLGGNNAFTGPGFNVGAGGQTNVKSSQPRKTVEFYQKSEKAKDLCKRALGELEYKRVKQFKDNLESALEMLESIDRK